MSVRALMYVTNIRPAWEGAETQKVVELAAHYDNTILEHQRFQQATPSGAISMQIDNPAALEQFKVGDYYYVDFAPTKPPWA